MAPYIRVWEDRRRDGIDAVYGLVQVVASAGTPCAGGAPAPFWPQ